MDMEIVLTGGKKVEARYKGYTIKTDQPEFAGGNNSAPSPFDLFLASIGTCAGFYVLSFCQERNIDTKEIKINLNIDRNNETKMVNNISIEIQIPSNFPEQYKKAVIKAAEQCTVKKHLLNPPEFKIHTKNI